MIRVLGAPPCRKEPYISVRAFQCRAGVVGLENCQPDLPSTAKESLWGMQIRELVMSIGPLLLAPLLALLLKGGVLAKGAAAAKAAVAAKSAILAKGAAATKAAATGLAA